MPKQLLVMRHAKSSWANSGITDFERPLNKRGYKVAPQVAEFIHAQGLTPDLVVSSPARRARTTAEIFVEHCDGMSLDQLVLEDSFYHAPARVYREYLTQFSEPEVETLMFVGHNPGMESLIEQLGGDWEPMPTAAVAHFELKVDSWSELTGPIKAQLKNFWRPKEIDIF